MAAGASTNSNLAAPGTPPEGDVLERLTALYDTEANLVQQKATHILSIRSLALVLFGAVSASSIAYPNRGFELLALALLPIYYLDAVYDAYLIPIVEREVALRGEIAARLERVGVGGPVISAYRREMDHRRAPRHWSPLGRALAETTRVAFYGALILIALTAGHVAAAFGV